MYKRQTLGRLFDVLGNTIDEKDPPKTEKKYPIHRPAPEHKDLSTNREVLETGIKVVDLMEPYTKGGKTKNPSPISWSASLSSLFALGGSLVTVLTGNKLL